MRNKIKEIALQAGGSHYPDVNGDVLQKFADLLLAECIKLIKETPNHNCYTSFDVAHSDGTKAECINHIKKVLM
jgi:hypothetical protein